MEVALRHKGIPIGEHRAHQIKLAEYDNRDLIIAMDDENLFLLDRIIAGDPEHKVHTLMEYTARPEHRIEDPWYSRHFDKCLDEIILGCRCLLEHLEHK